MSYPSATFVYENAIKASRQRERRATDCGQPIVEAERLTQRLAAVPLLDAGNTEFHDLVEP